MENKVPAIHQKITLYQSAELFILEPVSREPFLIINRKTGELSSHPAAPISQFCPNESITKQITIYGCIGIIKLHSGPFLVVIKDRALMGQLRGKPVYSVARTAFLPFSTQEITERQKKYQRTYKRVLKQLLESNKDFYFSYEIDLTHSQQRDSQYRAAYNLPLWKRADDRFFWNYFLQQKLMELGLDSWILPVIRGCVQMFTFVLADNIFDFVLISRRSRFRAGTRYNTRGVDPQGRVANFVETEQIINHNGHWTSFVQTRGSIPLFWQQKGYKLKPTPKLSEDATGMVLLW